MSSKNFLSLFLGILSLCSVKAQNFNYTLTKDSSSYSSLNSPTVLLQNEDFVNKHLSVRLPFNFNFCGSSTDSIVIESNGFLVFDKTKKLSLISFNNFSGNKDSLQNNVASINYAISGTIGNRILVFEFKNLSIYSYSYYDNLSYQIWLYEDGNVIEYHIGQNAYSIQQESNISVMLGAINQNMDTENKAYLITGSAWAPIGQIVSNENNVGLLNNIPSGGVIYRLTPTF